MYSREKRQSKIRFFNWENNTNKLGRVLCCKGVFRFAGLEKPVGGWILAMNSIGFSGMVMWLG